MREFLKPKVGGYVRGPLFAMLSPSDVKEAIYMFQVQALDSLQRFLVGDF